MATIKQRGDSYKITVSCGYDLNGKQIRRHLTWTPEPGMTARQIKKELDRQAVLFEEKMPQRSGARWEYQVCRLCGKVVRGLCRKAAATNDYCRVSSTDRAHQCSTGTHAHRQAATASYCIVL